MTARLRNLTVFGSAWLILLIAAVSYWFNLQSVLADGRDQDFLFFSRPNPRSGIDGRLAGSQPAPPGNRTRVPPGGETLA